MKTPVIYVAGPYTGISKEERDRNIVQADEIGRKISTIGLSEGMLPRVLIPHNLTARWEDDPRFYKQYDLFLLSCFDWITNSVDALYFMGPSPGAERERSLAELLEIPVIKDMEQVRFWLKNWKREYG